MKETSGDIDILLYQQDYYDTYFPKGFQSFMSMLINNNFITDHLLCR